MTDGTSHESIIDAMQAATAELNAATAEYEAVRASLGIPAHVPAVVRSETDPAYVAFMKMRDADERIQALVAQLAKSYGIE